MDTTPVWIGIDVAKAQLDIAVGAEGESWSLSNDEAGIETLLTKLRSRTCALVVLEATGGYEVPVVRFHGPMFSSIDLPLLPWEAARSAALREPAVRRRALAWWPRDIHF